MRPEDLRTLAQLGRAFWADSTESESATIETVSAVSLLDLADEKSMEKAARALMDRASRGGMARNIWSNLPVAAGQPFYQLEVEERFLLVVLHLGRWSYSRVAKVLMREMSEIEEMAWVARVKLAQRKLDRSKASAYPVGASAATPHCPEYDSVRPWTQRFMDEEIVGGRERVFLQNHLMACSSCRRSLSYCREVYYAVDSMIPRLSSGEETEGAVKDLEAVTRHTLSLKAPSRRSFFEGLKFFLARPDVIIVLLSMLILALRAVSR